MGLIVKKFYKDTEGIGVGTWLFVLFPSAFTLGTFVYETTINPLVSPEMAPTLLGQSIDSLWVICAVITALSIFIYIAFGTAKSRRA